LFERDLTRLELVELGLQAAGFEAARDFLGSGTASNSRESNSYVPRLRQAFATVDGSGCTSLPDRPGAC
jgi:hypothetical protein